MVLIGTKQFATNSECHFVFRILWSCKFTEQFYRVSNNCYYEKYTTSWSYKKYKYLHFSDGSIQISDSQQRNKNRWRCNSLAEKLNRVKRCLVDCRDHDLFPPVIAYYHLFPFTTNNYFDYLPVLLHFN